VDRVPDAYLQVVALHNVLQAADMARAAELAKETVPSKAAAVAINKAIGAFLAAVVVPGTIRDRRSALVDARNAVEHFDEYYRGTSKKQKKDQVAKTCEERAQAYRIELEGPADRPLLRVGHVRPAEPHFRIDLVAAAPEAARLLVKAVHAATVQEQSPTAG
jgi:hypothetical protein